MESKSNGGSSAAGNGLAGLVVDSGRTCRAVHKALLKHYGVDTQVLDNGIDAVNLFASGAKYDILVIDMLLPGLDGLEVTRQIREMGVDCKIVGMSAYGGDEERSAFMEAGADEFFQKPLRAQQLLRILADINNDNDN